MSPTDRHRLILKELSRRGRASVTELATLAGTSEMTIRRDLELLESQGALRRVHGGAINLLLSGVEPPYALRLLSEPDAKRKLGKAVVNLLEEGETVILDTGTTTAAVADAMRERRFTVTPLSLHAAHTLAQMAGISLLMPGGYVRAGELSVYGDRAERAFADLRYDTFIVGCCGIDPVYGATAHDLEDVRVKRAAIRAARRRIVVATAEKLGKVAFGRICTINDIDTIVTDAPDTSEHVARLRAAEVTVITV